MFQSDIFYWPHILRKFWFLIMNPPDILVLFDADQLHSSNSKSWRDDLRAGGGGEVIGIMIIIFVLIIVIILWPPSSLSSLFLQD